jgi:hypothetical protein
MLQLHQKNQRVKRGNSTWNIYRSIVELVAYLAKKLGKEQEKVPAGCIALPLTSRQSIAA